MGVLMYAPILMVMPEVLHAVGLSGDPQRAELTVEVAAVRVPRRSAARGRFPTCRAARTRGGAREGWVDLRDGAAEPLWLSRLTETYWFSYVPEGELLYCQLNEIQERGESLDAFFARALAAADSLNARRFVLDLRHNGGGNGDLNRAIVRALLRSRFDERGRLFVITSRRTFSAAQMLICDLGMDVPHLRWRAIGLTEQSLRGLRAVGAAQPADHSARIDVVVAVGSS